MQGALAYLVLTYLPCKDHTNKNKYVKIEQYVIVK